MNTLETMNSTRIRDIEEALHDMDLFRNLYNLVVEENQPIIDSHPSVTHQAAAKDAIDQALVNYQAYAGYYVEALLPAVIDALVDI